MRHQDWGVVSPRWAGIRSEMTTVRGAPVHHLAARSSVEDAPTPLLVSAMVGSAIDWLDLIPPLSKLGPVIVRIFPARSPDTPALRPAGEPPPGPTPGSCGRSSARSGGDRVILHGWSMGGLVARHACLRSSPPCGPDDLGAVRDHPDRLPNAVTAFASAFSAMFIRQRPTLEVLDRLDVPTTVLCGTDDPLVDAATLEGHAQRPRWEVHPVDGGGHLLPVEVPDAYVAVVADWMVRTIADSGRGV